VLPERKVLLERKVRPAPLEHRVLLEHKVWPVRRVLRDRRV